MFLSQQSSLFIFLLSILFITNISAQAPPMQNNKVVHTETCWTYPINNGIAAKKAYKSAYIEYNRQGKKSKMRLYNEQGQITKEYLYNYTSNRGETYQLLPDGSKLILSKEQFNASSQLVSSIRYGIDGSIEDKILMHYNQEGNKIKEAYFIYKEDKLEPVYEITYAYHDFGIRENYINYTEEVRHLGATELDENHLPKVYSEYASSGELIRTIHYERSPQGQLLSVKFLKADESVQVREDYEYNGSSMHCFVYKGQDNALVERVMYQYDYYH